VNRTAIFPARGGSVRIPRKNIRDFMGKPMLQWPIEAAKASNLFDTLVVSTDDQEIAALARRLDCEVHMREPDDGSVGTQVLAGRVLQWLGQSIGEACVIYPCSPMLQANDLQAAYWRLHTPPMPLYVMSAAGHQDAGCYYFGLVGAFIAQRSLETHAYRMHVDSARFIDINTPEDLARAESMFKALHP
jgi:CMP-N-acetylneuraminic acid synthetase